MKHLIAAAATALIWAPALQAQAWETIETFGGAWASDWGEVWVMPRAAGYQGTYEEDNGRFTLDYDGHVFVGYWAEDMSGQRCDVPLMGSYYWGRLELGNSSTYPGFRMLWGYCNQGPLDKVWTFYERLPDGL
ncbi:hypothetical protein [Rhodovulum adriaticum]|uniref:MORN repeat protein n=1 Tax=Rhodovulum adriaticum TaxID=35804 RepID=A0A4R2NM33_RHOAD|nr:hypothetical protein [Rhodovulum adriaticum]MBK1636822.1 hypothetical protein [Rhodovulum adriaticum]TCP22709.1 hypothetical protein EV656_1058 [Rhodovulum adriaticum]